ncbi:MAG: GIY-YIG nuclease family protein [Patescibacteria group bacterium]|jgi:putative endonuclease
MSKYYYVYILASCKNGTLYTGVTNDLIKRVYVHKNKYSQKGFTTKYGICLLVYYEMTEDVNSAIAREKQIKNWHRSWKIQLIKSKNPDWKDLYEEICI